MALSRRCPWLGVFVALGCDKGLPPTPPAPVTVAFGDCAPAGSTFVVGPIPQAWTDAELAKLDGSVPQLYTSSAPENDVVAAYLSGRDLEREAPEQPPLPQADAGALEPWPRIIAPHRAGQRTPLRAMRSDLVDCFRLQPARHGHVLFDLAPGKITVHGLEHEAFARCIAALAAKLPVDMRPERCPAVFGPTRVGDLPGIDIDAQDVKVYGERLADTQQLLHRDSKPWWQVPAIIDAVSSRARTALTREAPLTELGPLVLRAEPQTPMKVVNAVVVSVIHGAGDVALAARSGMGWYLLRERPLPFPAVLAGTGGRIAMEPSRSRTLVVANKAVRLSLLVGRETTSIGLSRVNEFAEIKTADTAALETALRTHKASAFFADRQDIQIAGADDATYEQVIQLIELATKVGFTDWALTPPVGLAARSEL